MTGDDNEVLSLLEETSDYDQSTDEARQELVDDGIDVDAFLLKVSRAIEEERVDGFVRR